MALAAVAQILAETIEGPDDLHAEIEAKLGFQFIDRDVLADSLRQLRAAAVRTALERGCRPELASPLLAQTADLLPGDWLEELTGPTDYMTIVEETADTDQLGDQIGACFAAQFGRPADGDCALAGMAMFTAVLGGVLGVLLEEQLLALGGPTEGAPP